MLARERDEPGETGYPRFLGDTAPFAAMKCRDSRTEKDRRGIKRRGGKKKTEHAANF